MELNFGGEEAIEVHTNPVYFGLKNLNSIPKLHVSRVYFPKHNNVYLSPLGEWQGPVGTFLYAGMFCQQIWPSGDSLAYGSPQLAKYQCTTLYITLSRGEVPETHLFEPETCLMLVIPNCQVWTLDHLYRIQSMQSTLEGRPVTVCSWPDPEIAVVPHRATLILPEFPVFYIILPVSLACHALMFLDFNWEHPHRFFA